MNPKRRSSFNTDGFISPRRPIKPISRKVSENKDSMPKNQFTRRSTTDQDFISRNRGTSLLNTTISSNQYNSGSNVIKPKKKKWSRKRKVVTTVLIILLIILGLGGWYGSRILSSIDKVFHGNIFSDVQSLFTTTKLKGERQGRVNILLAGYQGTVSDEGPLTDSIMIVSIDTKNNTAFTMSIPRDLWINIPNLGYNRINAANTNANFSQSGYFKGGMGQLQQVIEQDFGIPIDYYALIDYTAFQDAVNAVGGININIQSPDPRGLYDPNVDKAHGGPVRLPNGNVHLDGLQALALALARGDSPYAYGFPLSDINRTQHQRQMLIALEQKALSAGVLTNPVSVTRLFSALSNNVRTDLNLPDALRLAQLAKIVNVSKIQSFGLSYSGSNPLLTTYNASGQDVLIPKAGLNNFSQIQHYYLQITSNNPVVQEDASVSILNGSNVPDLAHTEAKALTSVGFNVVYVGNASTNYTASMVLDNSSGSKPNSSKYLAQLFSVSPVNSTAGSAEAMEGQGYTSQFVVVIGKNWASKH